MGKKLAMTSSVSPDISLYSRDEDLAFLSDYIGRNGGTRDVYSLRLHVPKDADRALVNFAIDQIECRHRFGEKLPRFCGNPSVLFPSVLSGEQSSNESVARYNALVAGKGKSALDMTAGLGIDAGALAENFNEVTACEMDPFKFAALRYNMRVLGRSNVEAVCADSMVYLADSPKAYGLIFVDPARRGENNRKLVSLTDCRPDIVARWELMRSKSEKILVKASPMLDISTAIRELPGLTEVHAVSRHGECKELLLVASRGAKAFPGFFAVDVSDDGPVRKVTYPSRPSGEILYVRENEISDGGFIYVPGASVMKIGRWPEFASLFPTLKKLASNTHLFYGVNHIGDFPGKVYQIEKRIGSKDLKALAGIRCNVMSRNHPLSTDALAGKAKIKAGDENMLIACRISKAGIPTMFLCKKIS